MLEALGNIGDFVGGIGVVITLAYLAIQIRHNSKTTKAAAAESVMQSMSEYFRSSAESDRLAHIIRGAFLDFDALEADEQARFHLWVFAWFRLVELAHHHYRLGNIPDSFWDGQVAHLSALVDSPGVQRFWTARKGVFSTEFQAFVESLDNAAGVPTGPELMKIIQND